MGIGVVRSLSSGMRTARHPLLFTPPQVINVVDYGVVGDGVTDDTTAIASAASAANAAGGGTVYFPGGTYNLTALPPSYSNVTYRGAGMWLSVLKPATSTANLIVGSSSTPVQNVVWEDLGFDSTNVTTAFFNLDGSHVQSGIIRRCRFLCSVGTNSVYGMNIARASGWLVEDCLFYAWGTANGIGLNFREGCTDNIVRRCKFLALNDGVLLASASSPSSAYDEISDRNEFRENYFDLHWYGMRALFSGAGAGVTYSATVLTDTGAAFTGLTQYSTLRAMPVRTTGTITTVDNAELTDTSATFTDDGIISGEIVRNAAATKFAYVVGVHSDTKIRHEGWINTTTYLPTSPPAVGETYTIWGLYIAAITSATATTITSPRFHDLNGVARTPSAGDRYEMLYTKGGYALHGEHTVRGTIAVGNTCLRGWADQISLYGDENLILGNVIRDGQDTAITCNHWGVGRSIISNNKIGRHGAEGIWCTAPDSIICGNLVGGIMPFQNYTNVITLGGIMVRGETFNSVAGGARTRVCCNTVDLESGSLCLYGITVSNSAVGAIVEGNVIRRVITSGIEFNGAGTTSTRLRGNVVSDATNPERYTTSATAGVVEIEGADSPESVRSGAIGSRYFDTTNGVMYIKKSGAGTNTGWKLVTQAA